MKQQYLIRLVLAINTYTAFLTCYCIVNGLEAAAD